jgi:hypothetical protein
MNLKAKPFICYVKFFFQLVDNALADITEWSYIVRKYADRDAHIHSLMRKSLEIEGLQVEIGDSRQFKRFYCPYLHHVYHHVSVK